VSSLRVGINLLWLLPGEGAGAEVYSMRVLRALLDEPAPDLDVAIFANRRLAHTRPDELASVPLAIAPIDGGSRPARIAAESTWLPREASRRRLDLVHHMADVVPWLRGTPSVLTIHDLRAIHRPDILGSSHAAYLRARLRPSVRASAVVITPTETVRSSVVEDFGGDPERVRVVSAPLFAPAEDPTNSGIAEPFFLYPSTTEPHKNHATLIGAFARIARTRPDLKLVLTGAPGRSEREVAAEIERRGMGEAVLRLGRVPRERLDALIARAVAVVYPSEYEGFGLPLAEAMAAGCPVIASDLPVIREVVGEAGVLVDPGDAEAWADALSRVLDDEPVRERLATAGRERAARYTPAETSRRLSEAYRLAAGRSRPTA
jgi:glycosyltransferase involved in cell wall biosynthesis